ncbi:MAG: hypothetical protein R3B40_29480 [Polyangiales bacterium]
MLFERAGRSAVVHRAEHRHKSLLDSGGGLLLDRLIFRSVQHRLVAPSEAWCLGGVTNATSYQLPPVTSIPSDGLRDRVMNHAHVNLTLYEAMLAFGESAAMVQNIRNFDEDEFAWFYTVFTPFDDTWTKLPEQSLVTLGWGKSEQLISVANQAQGLGHLPRADTALNEYQIQLLRDATAEHDLRKVVLATHFTFVSYDRDKTMMDDEGNTGGVGVLADSYGPYSMGTFNDFRPEVNGMLRDRKIHCTISGHSHRRGVYLLDRDGALSRPTVPRPRGGSSGTLLQTRAYDSIPRASGGGFDARAFARQHGGEGALEPAIIMSDSAGPYPLGNRYGEFDGYCPDLPAGTVVDFTNDGRLQRVRTLQGARNQPRAAVAMDYFDIMNNAVFNDGSCVNVDGVLPSRERDAFVGAGGIYKVEVPLTDEIRRLGISVESISFFGHGTFGDAAARWVRIQDCRYDSTLDRWVMQAGRQSSDFFLWLHRAASRFVSFRLRCDIGAQSDSRDSKMRRHIHSHLDWQSAWNIEVTVGRRRRQDFRLRSTPGYTASRPSRKLEQWGPNFSFKDYPNFEYRKRNFPGYQAVSS